jgi:hypothetical protein
LSVSVYLFLCHSLFLSLHHTHKTKQIGICDFFIGFGPMDTLKWSLGSRDAKLKNPLYIFLFQVRAFLAPQAPRGPQALRGPVDREENQVQFLPDPEVSLDSLETKGRLERPVFQEYQVGSLS